MRINSNLQAQMAQRHLGYARSAEATSLEKLASGSRINHAGDDAAGLAISEKLRAKDRSLRQNLRNASDGVSLIQTAEGAMQEISNILMRFRELSIQAASDTVSDVERGFIDKEVQQLSHELKRIAQSTEYNGTKLLGDKPGIIEMQVGTDNNPDQDRFYYDVLLANMSPERLGLGNISVATKEAAQANLSKVDAAIRNLSDGRASMGALQNRLQSAMSNIKIYDENIAGSNSRLRDTDMADQTAELTRANILTQSGLAVMSQANQNSKLALKLLGG